MSIKTKFIGFDADFSHENSKLLELIKETYPLIEVTDNPELIIHSIQVNFYGLDSYPTAKKLLISAENYLPFDLERNPFFNVLHKTLRHINWDTPFTKKFLEVIENIDFKLRQKSSMYQHSPLVNSPPKLIHPYYTAYMNDLLAGNLKNCYAITTNSHQAPNIFNLPYFLHNLLDEYQAFLLDNTQPLTIDTSKKKFCTFIASNNILRGRVNFCRALAKYKRIDCYGKLLNNSRIPPNLRLKFNHSYREKQDEHNVLSTRYVNLMNQEIFKNYKFVICFENSLANDYITEKLTNVLLSGSIPIYKGAKNVGNFFNTKRLINYDDFTNYQEMIDHVINLDKHDDKYQEVVAQPIFPNNTPPERWVNAHQDLISFLNKCFYSDDTKEN